MRIQSSWTNTIQLSCIAVSSALLLQACGEFSYKRGASFNDLNQAKRDCQSAHKTADRVEQCLAEKGWVVRNFDDEDPVMTIETAESTHGMAKAPEASRSHTRSEPLAEGSEADVAADQASTEATLTTDTTSAKSQATSPETTTTPATKPQVAKPAAPKPKDPLDIFLLSSWWKMGAGPAALKTDTETCVAKLGEVHRPDPVSLKTTRGLLICMREKGWYALQAK